MSTLVSATNPLLHAAVRDRRADTLDILLENGANPYLIVTLGVTAFEFALCDRIEFAPILIRNLSNTFEKRFASDLY